MAKHRLYSERAPFFGLRTSHLQTSNYPGSGAVIQSLFFKDYYLFPGVDEINESELHL